MKYLKLLVALAVMLVSIPTRACKTYEKCEVNVIAGGAHGFPSSVTHVKANENVVRFLKRIL